MTVNDIYTQALGILTQRVNDSDLSCFAAAWMNLLLAAENSVRLAGGKPPLDTSPTLTSLSDEVPYCDEITKRALLCGMAAFLYEAADDGELACSYRARWAEALRDACRGIPGGTDVY